MTHAAPATTAEPPPHKYIGGDPSVDFVNTVDWTSRGLVDERLDSYLRLTRWAEGAGVIAPVLGAVLRHTATESPADADDALRAAHALRVVVQQLFTVVAHERPAATAIAALDPFVADALAHRELAPARRGGASGAAARWLWRAADTSLTSPLWPVVLAAAELVVSPEAARLRVCGAPECGWMYVDRSRNGLRRWCQMEVCGTREKSRRRAARTTGRRDGR